MSFVAPIIGVSAALLRHGSPFWRTAAIARLAPILITEALTGLAYLTANDKRGLLDVGARIRRHRPILHLARKTVDPWGVTAAVLIIGGAIVVMPTLIELAFSGGGTALSMGAPGFRSPSGPPIVAAPVVADRIEITRVRDVSDDGLTPTSRHGLSW